MCACVATLVFSQKIIYGCIGMCIGCSVDLIELSARARRMVVRVQARRASLQDPIGTNGDSHSPRGDEVLA
jgi:hypothetical protein